MKNSNVYVKLCLIQFIRGIRGTKSTKYNAAKAYEIHNLVKKKVCPKGLKKHDKRRETYFMCSYYQILYVLKKLSGDHKKIARNKINFLNKTIQFFAGYYFIFL